MKGICSKTDCAIKHGLPCELGHSETSDCPHFQVARDAADLPPSTHADEASGQRLPWTGRGLGLNDLGLVSGRAPAQVVGLFGPFNAGKTALLTALFAHFSQTGLLEGHAFAGSFTLQGWSNLKQYTTWPAVNGPMFPPHTPDSSERVPSLLHLAFRSGQGLIRDLLFTDAPGEWFTRWVRNQASDEAKGARWIADHASRFVFVVDRAGLAGDDVGLIRQNTLSLARLLGEHRRGRPVTAVWTKSDGRCDAEMEAPVRHRLNELLGEHPSLDVAVDDPACLRVLAFLLSGSPQLPSPPRPRARTASAFLAYGDGLE